MDNNFMNKLDRAYRKGFSSNPQFAEAAKAIGEFAKGEDILKQENMRGRIESQEKVKRQPVLNKEPEEMEL